MNFQITDIFIFLFVLSLIYLIKEMFGFFINFFSENPKPIMSNKGSIIIYLSVAYVITFILKIFI